MVDRFLQNTNVIFTEAINISALPKSRSLTLVVADKETALRYKVFS
jgi:hypothetical protein